MSETKDPDEGGQAGEGAGVEPLPVDWSTEPVPAYANGAHVVHTPREFSVIFTELAGFPGRLSASGAAGEERARVVGSIRMTPDVYFQMLCILASNWNRFANELIDPRMRRPRFKLLDAGDVQLEGVPQKRADDD
jgi:hypothetical protein